MFFRCSCKRNKRKVCLDSIQTACDKNGFVTSFSVHKRNEHDSRTFKALYDKIKEETKNKELEKIVAYRVQNTSHCKIINR